MSKLTRNDKILLESLNDKYGKELLASVLVQMAGGMNNDNDGCCEEGECCSPQEAVLEFIKYLEGARIRMREIHWETDRNSTHKLTDDYIGKLETYEDDLAENLMGICGFRIKVGEIVPKMSRATDIDGLMTELFNMTLELIASVEGDRRFTGIVNILEDMMAALGSGEFLKTMK